MPVFKLRAAADKWAWALVGWGFEPLQTEIQMQSMFILVCARVDIGWCC